MSFFATAARFPITLLSRLVILSLITIPFIGSEVHALDLDWHGQFRAETNWLFGYSHGQNAAPATANGVGYFIPQNGDSPASFQNLFFRLEPRVIVNDNVSLHSDLWLGSPDRGVFGGDAPDNSDFFSTRTGRAAVSASELYADVATDFGTITVGRAPLNWGLGVVWNNNKEGFDRLPSTADVIRLTTKLGAFKFMPGIVKYRNGTNYGGSAGANGTTTPGSSSATDYTVGLTYNNDDEQIELGVMFMRRLAGLNSQIQNPFAVPTTAGATSLGVGYAYNIWDFYANKRAGIFNVSAEVPFVTGFVAGHPYSTVAGAGKVKAQVSEHWALTADVGSADGQASAAAVAPGGQAQGKLTTFYFSPDYRPALVMFNYNLRNFSSLTNSPYDNPVTNARFLALSADYNSGKWTHGFKWIYAVADKTADGVAGNVYFNTWDRTYRTENAGAGAQDKGLGWELDYALGYQWDEAIRFGIDSGLYFPGKFYEWSNGPVHNTQKTVWATNLNLMVRF